MLSRTGKKTVTFNDAFFIGNSKETHPAGDYAVETDEELILGLSFTAYRRVSCRIYLKDKIDRTGTRHTLTIDPKELDAALARDPVSIEPTLEPVPGVHSNPSRSLIA